MSHPNPSHDKSNEYPSDHYRGGSLESRRKANMESSKKAGKANHKKYKGFSVAKALNRKQAN